MAVPLASRMNRLVKSLGAFRNTIPSAQCKGQFCRHFSADRTEDSKKERDFDEFTRHSEQSKEDEKRRRQRDDEDGAFRERILKASLGFVNDLGWTHDSIQAGTEELGYPAVTSGIITDGPIELIHFHMRTSDARLEDAMQQEVESLKERGERLRIGPFIRDKVESRLRMNIPYLSRWAEAMALLSHPLNVASSAEIDLRLFDSIWHFAGDTSSDYNWYTKRLTLGAIYKATELAMMDDRSEDFRDTWDFLDRRFKEENELRKLSSNSEDVANVIKGVFKTVENIVGLQRK